MNGIKNFDNDIYYNPINLPVSGHKLITCHYPFRIDTYSGCYHNCGYCYGKSVLKRVGAWRFENVKVADIDDIKQKMEYYLNVEDNQQNPIVQAIQNKVPVRLGAQTDCLQPAERNHEVTYELIKYLNSIDYPYLIVTKSDLLSEDKYLSLLRKDLAYVQVTVTTLDQKKSTMLEPGAPVPLKRLQAVEKLNKAGIFTAGRISPVIPNITEEECEAIIGEFETAGADHIIFELFRGSVEMIDQIEVAVGKPVYPVEEKGFYFRLPQWKKARLYDFLASVMAARKMTFTFCSDGTPVPFDLHSCRNCCGTESLTSKIFETEFNHGNEKVVSTLYFELVNKGEVALEDMVHYFTFNEREFRKFWHRGEFANYIYNCEWDKNKKVYRLKL